MAKTKMNSLVPEDEQPYKVPDNWVWVRLNQVCYFKNGYAFKSNKYREKGIPILRISNIVNGIIDISDCVYYDLSDEYNEFLVNKGDLLIAMSGATTGKNGVYYRDDPAYLNQRVGNIRVINRNILEVKFRDLFIIGKNEEILNNAYGGAQPNISAIDIGLMFFPLPPLAEQKRIIKRIENLFEKLDRAKELAQNALDSFETRKAAILHKAFNGELTAKWRKVNNIDKRTWKILNFSDVAEIECNLVDPKKYLSYPHIAPDNIEKRTGELLDYNTIKEDGVTSGKHKFYQGQIIYSKIRPYLSKVIIANFDGLCSADMYPIKAKGDNKYLWYYMLSDEFLEQASNAGSRSLLPKINQKELSILSVPVPSLPEQQEIVRILDCLFEKERRARELCGVIEKIDLMKKAILARAFRGELGTNVEGEEKVRVNEHP